MDWLGQTATESRPVQNTKVFSTTKDFVCIDDFCGMCSGLQPCNWLGQGGTSLRLQVAFLSQPALRARLRGKCRFSWRLRHEPITKNPIAHQPCEPSDTRLGWSYGCSCLEVSPRAGCGFFARTGAVSAHNRHELDLHARCLRFGC